MSQVTCHVSMSLDGFIGGPDQSLENPIGIGGRQLHTWHIERDGMHEVDAVATDELLTTKGAVVMGRNMFGPIRGDWSDDWRGWWGDEPPYHAPVFVLTHYEREPVEMAGGTTFHFVTEGFDVAMARAREVAGDKGIRIAGGASTVRQAFSAGVVEDLYIDVIPLLLGRGERIFGDVPLLTLTQLDVTHSPIATHLHYRVGE